MAGANIEVYTGRKWNALKELKLAEERLREKMVLGTVGRAWLFFPQLELSKP